MSTSERLAGRRGDDRGFSLIEIVVAMGLLMVVLTASLPMLLSMMRSTVVTKMNTQAKNLAQERLEQLRDLRFHVDRQNGPFLDLLDLYYTNASSAGTPTTVASGAGSLTGRYVATGSRHGVAAPLYEVVTSNATGAPTGLPGAADFSQVVLAQFLAADGSVLAASAYQDVYNSQIVGRDAPPSLMVRFTAITSWVQAGTPKTYRTTTVITEGPPESPVIQTQSKAVAVSIGSTGADASTLQLQGGLATLDGAQSSGSSVSGYVTGALATRAGARANGSVGQFSLPSQLPTTTGPGGAQSETGCGWYAFGPNAVHNITADVAAGLPKAPADVDAATPPNVMTGEIRQGTSNACGMLSFDNLAGGGTARSDTVGTLMGSAPYARIPDSSSSSTGVLGSGYVTASTLAATPQQAKAGARVAMGRPVVLFPNNPDAGGQGLLSAQVSSGSVDCVSGTATTLGTVAGKYTLALGWWGRSPTDTVARWHSRTWTYDSAAGTPLSSSGDTWEPDVTVLSNGAALSSMVQVAVPGGSQGRVSTGAMTGLRGFPNGIVTLTTAPTLSNESGTGHSAVKVQLGQLTCVADDQR